MKMLESLKKWWRIRTDIWMGRRCFRCLVDVSHIPIQRVSDPRGTEWSRLCSCGNKVPVPSAG